MTRQNKFFWGILSFLPLVVLVIATILLISHFAPYIVAVIQGDDTVDPGELIPNIMYVWISMVLIGLLSSLIWLAFLVFSLKDKSYANDQQILWIILLLFGNVIVLPIYWYFRMWNNPDFTLTEHITERSN